MRALIAVAASLALAGCTAGSTGGAEDPPTAPDDAVVVVGVETCDAANASYAETVGSQGQQVATLVLTCTTQMSDPRMTGAETVTLTYRVPPPGQSFTFTAEAVLTTGEGAWRGTGRGVGDEQGVAPFAEGVATFTYAELDYAGEGTYQGLAYHGRTAGTADAGDRPGVVHAGWIRTTS